MLTLEPCLENGFKVYYENGVYLGDILMKEDGFYDFWPDLKGGCWPEHLLRTIADELHTLNIPWEQQIEKDFS